MIGMQPFAEKHHRHQGAENGHQVYELPRRAGAHDLHPLVPEQVGPDRGKQRHVTDRHQVGRSRLEGRLVEGVEPENRRQGQGADQHGEGEKTRGFQLRRTKLQANRIDRPHQRRRQHPQVAAIDLQRQQALQLPLGDQDRHAGGGNEYAEQLVPADRQARVDARQQDDENRNETVDQQRVGRRGLVQPEIGQGVETGHAEHPEQQHLPLVGENQRPLLQQRP